MIPSGRNLVLKRCLRVRRSKPQPLRPIIVRVFPGIFLSHTLQMSGWYLQIRPLPTSWIFCPTLYRLDCFFTIFYFEKTNKERNCFLQNNLFFLISDVFEKKYYLTFFSWIIITCFNLSSTRYHIYIISIQIINQNLLTGYKPISNSAWYYFQTSLFYTVSAPFLINVCSFLINLMTFKSSYELMKSHNACEICSL